MAEPRSAPDALTQRAKKSSTLTALIPKTQIMEGNRLGEEAYPLLRLIQDGEEEPLSAMENGPVSAKVHAAIVGETMAQCEGVAPAVRQALPGTWLDDGFRFDATILGSEKDYGDDKNPFATLAITFEVSRW
jgi:hypothetical protein